MSRNKNCLLSCLEKYNPELIGKLELLYSKSLDKVTVNKIRQSVGSELQEMGI